MNTYYLSYECKPLPGHENALRYSGMVADVFVSNESEDGVEERVEMHFKREGWEVERMDYAELVTAASAHDARFGALYHASLKEGIAALFSPY